MHKLSVKKIVLIVLALTALSAWSYNVVLAQEDETKEELRESGPFRGYAKYKAEFKSLCDALEKDGRRLTVLELVKAEVNNKDSCYACRPLLQQIESSCRSATVKKLPKKTKKQLAAEAKAAAEVAEEAASQAEEEVEETATPTPSPTAVPIYRQRDPNLAVLQSTLAIFSSLAADELSIEPSYEAVLYLRTVLLADQNLSPGSRDYLETLCEYLLAPYAAYADKLEREERQIKKREEERKRKIDVDALLDF